MLSMRQPETRRSAINVSSFRSPRALDIESPIDINSVRVQGSFHNPQI